MHQIAAAHLLRPFSLLPVWLPLSVRSSSESHEFTSTFHHLPTSLHRIFTFSQLNKACSIVSTSFSHLGQRVQSKSIPIFSNTERTGSRPRFALHMKKLIFLEYSDKILGPLLETHKKCNGIQVKHIREREREIELER